MDYFLVYVSSITEGVIWELEHLKAQGYADRTTVVFDRSAILNKGFQSALFESLMNRGVGEVTWKPSTQHSTEENIDALWKNLSETFEVIPSGEGARRRPAGSEPVTPLRTRAAH